MAEQYEIKVVNFPPSEVKFHWQCPQCRKGITNEDAQWEIRIERWGGSSYEACMTGKFTLAGQSNLRMCNECYEAIKKYFS